MKRQPYTFNILMAGGLLAVATAVTAPSRADEWVTINPDGSATRTQIKQQNGANTFSSSTVAKDKYELTAPELVEIPDRALRAGDVVDGEALKGDPDTFLRGPQNRGAERAGSTRRFRGNTVIQGRTVDNGGRNSRRRDGWRAYRPQPQPQQYPYYPAPAYPYGYPAYGNSYGNTYVLPGTVYSGPIAPAPFPWATPPWITTIPLGTTVTTQPYCPPGYEYPATTYPGTAYPGTTYPGTTYPTNPYPYPSVGYPAGTVVVPQGGYYYPNGTGVGTVNNGYGTFSYNRGGIGITIGGGRTTTSTTTTTYGTGFGTGIFGR